MAKLKPESRFARRRVRLTAEEFASLKEVGNRPMQRSIPDEHQDRLIAVGYVREIVPYWGPRVLALAMKAFGYLEGRDFVVEWRFAEWKYENLVD